MSNPIARYNIRVILTALTRRLIGAVGTVALTIAAPFVGYAVTIIAAELFYAASGFCLIKKRRREKKYIY